MHLYRALWLFSLGLFAGLITIFAAAGQVKAQQTQPSPQPQRLVESVDVIGNRRLRKDDILYYVQTRPGDVYSPARVQSDYQAILSLGFFDKVQTRVTEEPGPRGGIIVTFFVVELPIIRDIIFAGLSS